MITYLWKFGTAEVVSNNGLVDVIDIVPWTLTASENGRSFTRDGRIKLPDPDPAKFVPMDKVTEALVTKWVEEAPAVEFAYIKALLAAEFLRPVAAPVVRSAKELPFNAKA